MKKKILALTLVLVLAAVMMFPVTGMASASPSIPAVSVDEAGSTLPEGAYLVVDAASADQLAAAQTAMTSSASMSGFVLTAVFDLKMMLDNEDLPPEPGTLIAIRVDGLTAADSIVILHQLSDGTWEFITPAGIYDGYFTFTPTSFSLYAVALQKAPAAPAAPAPEVSPQTGIYA